MPSANNSNFGHKNIPNWIIIKNNHLRIELPVTLPDYANYRRWIIRSWWRQTTSVLRRDAIVFDEEMSITFTPLSCLIDLTTQFNWIPDDVAVGQVHFDEFTSHCGNCTRINYRMSGKSVVNRIKLILCIIIHLLSWKRFYGRLNWVDSLAFVEWKWINERLLSKNLQKLTKISWKIQNELSKIHNYYYYYYQKFTHRVIFLN